MNENALQYISYDRRFLIGGGAEIRSYEVYFLGTKNTLRVYDHIAVFHDTPSLLISY